MERNKKTYDIQKKSDYVYDVLEKTPNWIISWGNTIFFLFIILLIVLSAFISYPDTITSLVKLTLENPPIAVVSEKSGEIEQIYYFDKDTVQKGQVVLKLYSRAKLNDVKKLQKELYSIQQIKYASEYLKFSFSDNLNIGELQKNYNNLYKDFDNFKYFLNNNLSLKRKNALQNEIKKIKQLNISLEKQEILFENQFQLSEKKYERNKALNKEGVISDLEKEEVESLFLTEKRQLENFRTNQINNEVKIEQIYFQIENLISKRKEESITWINTISEKTKQLQDEIEAWEKIHLMKTPITGRLSIPKKIVKNYYINLGETIFSIIPDKRNNIIGIAEVPIINSENINIGDFVQIRLDAFPYQHYGVLDASITDKSLIASQEQGQTFIAVTLNVSNPLITAFGETIPFTPNMTGKALLIKENKSLLSRIFDEIFSVFAN